ncbi:hypothetical protein Tco_0472751 [Tanacetum coccineum]
MFKFNIQAAIDKSVEARLKQIELPKGVPDFKKIKLEKERMAFNSHSAHQALYDALAVSLSIDEGDMDRIFGKGNLIPIRVIKTKMELQSKVNHFPNHPNLTKPVDVDELDWTNPEGDKIPQDFIKLLPLLGAHGQQYIPAEFFFNQDLEYLRMGNLEERKYTTSFTKTKATRNGYLRKEKKRSQKSTKPDTEWKSVEKTKSRQGQVNPDKSKVKPKATSEEK